MKFFLRFPHYLDQKLAQLFILLIKLYQKTLSPLQQGPGDVHGFRGCRFYPSCSAYGILVLKKYGFVLGLPRIIWRILRCNPWNQGGVDMP
jgi:uncharacterized protein